MNERLQRVNELLKRELSQIILEEIDMPRDVLTTITRVEASLDLRQARVYISIMPLERSSDVLKILNQLIYILQQKINKRLNMRPIPKIEFKAEKETGKAARIEELLEQIKNKE